MANFRKATRSLWFALWFPVNIVAGAPAGGADGAALAAPAKLGGHVDLVGSWLPVVAADHTLQCFEGADFALLNPGCFVTSNPSQPGDCTSSDSHFLVQYLFVDSPVPQRLLGFGFLGNDGETVFPSAGALLLPAAAPRFPTPAELSQLQVNNVQGSGDTTQVFVDLSAHDLVLQPGSPVALVLILQFPAGGQLVAPAQGPGIAAERAAPDERCDYFTVDGGSSGVWFEPRYDPAEPQSIPLDWGFVASLQPQGVGIESLTWSRVKRLYHAP